MTYYAPASSLGWLDLDTAASERVATLLRSLEEPGTIDTLGLGPIRDALSEMLTPGTSTVQTRLRYFIFLPWIFQRIEADGVAAADFAPTLRRHEAKLIKCLRRGGDAGVIGSQAGRRLRRMPSAIYWGSMEAWGIRRSPLSLADYGQRVTARKRPRIQRDDDHNAIEPPAPMWADIPAAPADFLRSEITFKLEPEEAQVLTDGIRRRHPDTLIAVLSAAPGLSLDGTHYPWEVPAIRIGDRLREVLRHARCFSELAHGPRLVYNLLVARDGHGELGWDTEELIDEHRGQLTDWAVLVGSRHQHLRAWADDTEEFQRLLAGCNIAQSTLRFWNDLARRAANDPTGFAESTEVHQRVRERERRLKAGRARLSNRSALESGGRPAEVGRLDYRWSVTRTYLEDLRAAEAAT